MAAEREVAWEEAKQDADRGLTLDDYQRGAIDTAVYPGQGGAIGLSYAVLGLNGEAGETGEAVKKMWRDDAADIEAGVLQAVTEARDGLRRGVLSYDVIFERMTLRIHEVFRPPLSEERRQKIEKELGDTLWYAAQVATEIGVSLGDVADGNLTKLAARRDANTLHGDGDER